MTLKSALLKCGALFFYKHEHKEARESQRWMKHTPEEKLFVEPKESER